MTVLSLYCGSHRTRYPVYYSIIGTVCKYSKDIGWKARTRLRELALAARGSQEAGLTQPSICLLSYACVLQISRDVLSTYFDEWTVDEWIEQHLLPLQETVSALNKRARKLTRDLNVWPRRPLEKSEQLEKTLPQGFWQVVIVKKWARTPESVLHGECECLRM